MRSVLDGYTPSDLIEVLGDEVPKTAPFTTFTFSSAAPAMRVRADCRAC